MLTATEPLVIMTRAELDSLIAQTARVAADAVAKRINAPTDDAIWTAADVAEYIGLAETTVANKLAYQRGFPAAAVLGNGPRATRRWPAKEVKAWVERQEGTRKRRKTKALQPIWVLIGSQASSVPLPRAASPAL